MSRRQSDADYGQTPTWLRLVLTKFRRTIATALPAAIQSFDRATRRATIAPSVRLRLTDGSEMPRRPIANVPVIFPAGGGYILAFPLAAGDQALRIASERGLTDFKRRFAEASPDPGAMLESRSAVAIPGFGPLEITPAGEGAVLQNVGATVWLEVHDDRIKLVKGSQRVELDDSGLTADVQGDIDATATGTITATAPSIVLDGEVRITGTLTIEGGSVMHDGKEIGKLHTHTPGVTGGGPPSGPVT